MHPGLVHPPIVPKPVPERFRSLAAEVEPVVRPYPEIALVYLFGSAARSQAHSGSDLDLGIVFARRGDTALLHVDLLGTLAAHLEGTGGFRDVDLVVLESQGPIFCQRVLEEGVLLYERDPRRRVDFESETMVRAFDFRPTYELAARGQVEALRRWLRERYDLR